jgi:DeoD family purine-nucleoside phosphorylase
VTQAAGSIHLQPTAELAERVLLPGDPGRALLLAQALLDAPKMFNHNRGLWGYTGPAADGELLTIQSTGMGGPSTAIVVAELHDLGAQRLLRVGTCGGLEPDLELGQLLVADRALPQDGTSRSLGAAQATEPDADLLSRLLQAARKQGNGSHSRSGTVVSTDLFYDGPADEVERWRAAGAVAVEMEAAALFALARRRGFQAGAVLIVSDLLVGSRKRIGVEELRAAEHGLGELALSALCA